MLRYYAQFPAGTQDLLLGALAAEYPRHKVHYIDESALIFQSRTPAKVIAKSPFLTNSFRLLASADRTPFDRNVRRLAEMVAELPFSGKNSSRAFRVMASIDGTLTPLDLKLRGAVEGAIATRTGGYLKAQGSCREYWIIGRKQLPDLLLCERLQALVSSRRSRGALSPQLSSLVVAAAEPSTQDVALDPFGGSGALVEACRKKVKRAWYSDIRLNELRLMLPRELTTDERVGFLADDALCLPNVEGGSVDVIVTDPPWGEYESIGRRYDTFASEMAESFARVLHSESGRLAVLVNRRNADILGKKLAAAGIGATKDHSILVNGHPASVLVRTNHPIQ